MKGIGKSREHKYFNDIKSPWLEKEDVSIRISLSFIEYIKLSKKECGTYTVPTNIYDLYFNYVDYRILKSSIRQHIKREDDTYIILDFSRDVNILLINYRFEKNKTIERENALVFIMDDFSISSFDITDKIYIEPGYYALPKLSEIARELNITFTMSNDHTYVILKRKRLYNNILCLKMISEEYDIVLYGFICNEMKNILIECKEDKCSIDEDFSKIIAEYAKKYEYKDIITKINVDYLNIIYLIRRVAKLNNWNLTHYDFIEGNMKILIKFVRMHT